MDQVSEFIFGLNINLAFITETWSKDSVSDSVVQVRGFAVVRVPWMPEVFLSLSDGILRSGERNLWYSPLSSCRTPVQCDAVSYSQSQILTLADPSNSIGSRNLSVLTSTLIGVATEISSNRFSISLSTLFPVATGHNRNAAAKSRKSRF